MIKMILTVMMEGKKGGRKAKDRVEIFSKEKNNYRWRSNYNDDKEGGKERGKKGEK